MSIYRFLYLCLAGQGTLALILQRHLDSHSLSMRDTTDHSATCAQNQTLIPCTGSTFPSDFYCPASSTCTLINGDSASSTICCPCDRDCRKLSPITCDISYQNATLHPDSPVHTENLTLSLPQCGHACCPLGFDCHDGVCLVASQSVSSSGSSSPTTMSRSSATATSIAPVTTPTGKAVDLPLSTAAPNSSAASQKSYSFSGRSFTAGFLPGIIIGAVLLALFLWLWLWYNRRHRAEVTNTTSLTSTSLSRKPSRRDISDPVVHPQYGERTTFYQRPRSEVKTATSPQDEVVACPGTPASVGRLRPLSLFHRSPNPTRTLHGTATPTLTQLPLSFRRGSMTPPHALRTKPSQHSLRRQMINQRPATMASELTTFSEDECPNPVKRQDSGETINIRMSSPVTEQKQQQTSGKIQHPLFFRPLNPGQEGKPGLWLSYRVPPVQTPDRGGNLPSTGTPYTPSKYGGHGATDTLRIPETARTRDRNRDTTFTSFMERAGIGGAQSGRRG